MQPTFMKQKKLAHIFLSKSNLKKHSFEPHEKKWILNMAEQINIPGKQMSSITVHKYKNI